MTAQVFTAIGMMSGTSLDGVDAALIRTDGHHFIETGPALTLPYPAEAREAIRSAFGKTSGYEAAEKIVTDFHIQAVQQFLADNNLASTDIDLIGFHGQTIYHAPHEKITVQIGDAQHLANSTGINVICDFRSADVAAGGQGSPLVPLYHQALAHSLPKPLAVLNIGGVANVTWFGSNGDILAFDTGPGNALIDDTMLRLIGKAHDENGEVAKSGNAHTHLIEEFLTHEFFAARPPKSLDRDQFQTLIYNPPLAGGSEFAKANYGEGSENIDIITPPRNTLCFGPPARGGLNVERQRNTALKLHNLSPQDQIATLTAFTASSITKAVDHMPERPAQWLICGGGRHNQTLMRAIEDRSSIPVYSVQEVNWDGDALEAQAFGYLAVRSKLRLPITLPETTGTPEPMTGGRFYSPTPYQKTQNFR